MPLSWQQSQGCHRKRSKHPYSDLVHLMAIVIRVQLHKGAYLDTFLPHPLIPIQTSPRNIKCFTNITNRN
jgi:hypothetical protein